MKRRIAHIQTITRKASVTALTVAIGLGGTGSVWRPRGGAARPPVHENSKAMATKPAERAAAPTKPGTPIQAPAAPRKGPLLIHFALYDAGIYPSEFHGKAGAVRLDLEDYSGGTAGVMVDNADTGAHMTIVKRDRDSWKGVTDLTLQPGRYVLHDVRSPDMKATLVMEP